MITTEYDAVCRRLVEARVRKGLSQPQLANQIGVSWRVLQNWETGKTDVPFRFVPDLCEALDVSVHWLMFGKED